jgi:hypothetical protein
MYEPNTETEISTSFGDPTENFDMIKTEYEIGTITISSNSIQNIDLNFPDNINNPEHITSKIEFVTDINARNTSVIRRQIDSTTYRISINNDKSSSVSPEINVTLLFYV